MKINQLRKNFTDSLKEEYPLQEISSFFDLLSREYLQMSRIDAALNPQAQVSEEKQKKFDAALLRLKKHEPIQYIIGKTEFFGMEFRVNEKVLVPRPETEELVQWILDEVKPSEELKILDIGTGSGCIAISLAKHLPQARISAIDISEKALGITRENSVINNTEVHFIQADILQQENLEEAYDIIVSNPPYVRELEKKEMHRNVLEHEPATALYVKDEDPLIFYRKITKLAGASLKPGGKLFFEINQYLSRETEELLVNKGFATELRKDIYGNFRMLKGEKK